MASLLAVAVAVAVAEPVLAWLGRTTWQAAVLIAIVAAVQLLLGRWLAPRWRYALWMLVVVRLLMPVTPSSAWSVFNVPMPRAGAAAAVVDDVKPQAADGVTVSVVRTFDGIEPVAPDAATKVVTAPAAFDWRRALLAVWAAGAALVILRVAVAHVLLTRRLRGAPQADHDVRALLDDCLRAMGVRTGVGVVLTDAVGGPALFGFVRPRLLVPPAMLASLGREDLWFVFLHELAHLRRRDTWFNVALALAGALHWFNPLVWLALARCRTERELACDAMVLEVADAPGARQGYGHTMLRLAEAICAAPHRRRIAVPAALGILETRSQLTRRIAMIANFRRGAASGRRWSVLPALLLVTVASCALTDKPSDSAPATQPAARAAVAAPRDTTVATPASPNDPRIPYEEPAAESVAAVAMRTMLARQIPELKLENVPLSDVIDGLRDLTGANIFVNWRALEAAGIDRQVPVTARLNNVKFSKALDVVLAHAGGGTVKLGYEADEGVITITTAEDLSRNVLTRVYDVRDLIKEIPDAGPPADAGAAENAAAAPTTQPQAKLVEQVMQLIQETVEPEAWRDAGGTIASMRELSGQLVITATPEMHQGIARLLHQVRETRGVQVAVESRFVTIEPALLDKALGGRLQGTLGKAGAATVWLLNDEETQAVLRAMQGSKQSTLVTAPRVTLFNGQRGWVRVTTQTAHVAGFTVFKKEGAETRYEPKVNVVESGIVLDVRATASADRKNAVISLWPRISRLEGLRPEPYMGAKDLYVQVPQLVVHELQTTLSIPDRGTALIGGFIETPNAGAANAGELIAKPASVETEVTIPDGGKLLLGGGATSRPVNSVTLRGNRPAVTVNATPPSQNVFLLVKPTVIVTQPDPPEEFPILSVPSR